jgi:hypothetical protein
MSKYLRIAVTALSLTACVLLIALWVRSCDSWDTLTAPLFGKCVVEVHSVSSRTVITLSTLRANQMEYWGIWSVDDEECFWDLSDAFYFSPGSSGPCVVSMSHWSLILVATAFATMPWMNQFRRFSLRNLLIATTLVAAALGVVTVIS